MALGFSASVSNLKPLRDGLSSCQCMRRQRDSIPFSVQGMAKKGASKSRPSQGSSPGKGQAKNQSLAGKSSSSLAKKGPPSSPSITNPSTSSDSLVLPLHEASSLLLPPSPPASEEEVLLQAEACLGEALSGALRAAEPMTLRQRQALGGKGGRRSRGAPAGSSTRIQVEIPTRDSESASAQVALALRLLPVVSPAVRQGSGQSPAPSSSAASQEGDTEATPASSQLPSASAGGQQASGSPLSPVTIFFSSQAAAEQASAKIGSSPPGAPGAHRPTALCLQSTTVVPKPAERVLVVSPGAHQARLVQAVVNSAGQRPVVLLNPGWAADGASTAGTAEDERAVQSLMQSFRVAYCFMPLAFQGMLGSSMGALLCAGPGWQKAAAAAFSGAPGEDAYWVLFKEEGSKSKRVAVLRKRPDSELLQNLLYAQMAAESPVSKSIQFVQSLFARP